MIDTCLSLHRLTFVEEGDEVVVGRPDTDVYAVFPLGGARLLERMRDGMIPRAAASWYEVSYGEPVDIEDFLDTLRELDFIREAGDDPDPAGAHDPALGLATADSNGPGEVAEPAVSLGWLGRAAFSAAAWAVYVLLTAVTIVAMVLDPELRPHPHHVFFTDSLLIVQITLLVGQTAGIAWHEGYHVLAGRRLNLPCHLSVGRRMYFIVFETTLKGLLGVPRRQRYLPFLAGMVGDVLMFCGLVLTAALTTGVWARLALALAFLTLLRFTWQFYLFLRTDLYYLFSTATGCHDLHGASVAYLRKLARRPREHAEDAWTERDRRMARGYAPFCVFGFVVLTATVAAALVPILVEFGRRFHHGIVTGTWDPRFWDSTVSAAFAVIPLLIIFALATRDRLRRHIN